MKLEQKHEIIAALEDFMLFHGMSANDVSTKLEINAAYISSMRNGKFSVNNVEIADKYFEKIANMVSFKLDKTYWDIIETPQMLHIIAALSEAKEYGNTSVILAESGAGKTFCANIFAKSHPIDCFIVTVGSQDSIGDLIEKISDKIKLTRETTRSRTLRGIVKKLANMKLNGYKPMIIFDESEYMKPPALCNMKELYDNLNGSVSLVMMGTHQLLKKLDRLRKKDTDGIPQFYRRIKFGMRDLPSIDRSYRLFFQKFGITDPKTIKFLVSICDNYGELHDVLETSMREADRLNVNVDEQLIRRVLNMPKN